MSRFVVFVGIAVAWAGSSACALAQAPALPEAPPVTVTQLEARVQAIVAQILDLDAGIEKRVDRIASSLKTIREASYAGTPVSRLKDDVLSSLQKCVEYYHEQRARRQDDLAAGDEAPIRWKPADDPSQRVERLERRISQVVSLAEAFTSQADFKEVDVMWATEREAAQRNRELSRRDHRLKSWEKEREPSAPALTREELVAGLTVEIEDLKSENARLESMRVGTNVVELARLDEEIVKNREKLAACERRISAVSVSAASPEHALDRQGAVSLDQIVREAVEGIKQDVQQLKQLRSALDAERKRLDELRATPAKPSRPTGGRFQI